MQKLYKSGLLLLLALLLASCGDDNYTAYFSGQVKNPRMPYLLFSRGNQIIDTIRLDKDNHFSVKFDSLTPGLYSFKHDPDYQFVYFDKNDSLVVSIDANNFDQSIIFGGRGDRKNNFMMELFALNDAERKQSYDIYAQGYAGFSKYIDSTYKLREAFYEKKKKQIEWSKGFDFYANYSLKLNYYTKKEYYAYIHARRTGKDIRSQLPKDFYSYRNDIDFNSHELVNFSPFMRYTHAFINNLAYYRTSKQGLVKENAIEYNINKLIVADSVFTDKAIKNQVLDNIAFTYLLEDQNVVSNQKFLERYDELSTDESTDNEIKQISKAIKQLDPGKKLPVIKLVDTNNKLFDIHNDIDRQTVIFFWTSCARIRLKKVYDRIDELKKEHPDVEFIAVNVDNDKEWKRNVDRYEEAEAQQLRATNFDSLRRQWVFTKINRTIVLNPDGTIKVAFANLMDDQFSNSL